MRNSLLLCLIITLTLISHFKVLSLPTIEIQIEDPNNQKFISLLDKNKINTIYEDLSDNNDINIVTYPPEMVVTTLKIITHDFEANSFLNVTLKMKVFTEYIKSNLLNLVILDNLEGFHNHSLFEPFSKVKMRKWTDLIYGEDLPKEAKELYLVHNCYTTGVFIVRGEITINESNPLKFKYQKICPPVEIRKDMKLQIAATNEYNTTISKIEDSHGIIKMDYKDPTWIKVNVRKGNQIFSNLTFTAPNDESSGISLKILGGREGGLVRQGETIKFALLAECKATGNFELHFNAMMYPYKSLLLKFMTSEGYLIPSDIHIKDVLHERDVFVSGKVSPKYNRESEKKLVLITANESSTELSINVEQSSSKIYTIDNVLINSKETIVSAEYVGKTPHPITNQHSQFVIEYTCHSSGLSFIEVTLLLSHHGKIEFALDKECSQDQVLVSRSKKGLLYYVFIIMAILLGCYLTFALKRLMIKTFNKYQPVPKPSEIISS